MDIVDLPRDIFLLIIAHLSARTAVACRRVSRRWNGAFADDDLSLQLLKWHFPRCREVRLAFSATSAIAAGDGVISTGDGNPGQDTEVFHRYQQSQRGVLSGSGAGGVVEGGGDGSRTGWAAVFANVASRYHHLRTATPRATEKIRHGAAAAERPGWSGKFLPVGTWDRYLRLNDKTAPFHYSDPGWCYSQEYGLLVYHIYEGDADEWSTYPWRWIDLEARREGVVPFAQGVDRVVRRVRLSDGVLIFEWCERQADHQPPCDREERHHFVTVYDVMPNTTEYDRGQKKAECGSGTWTITQRTEFRLNLGFSINRYSRFFSTHTNTHYAVYVWQEDRVSRDNHPIDVVVPRIVRQMTWNTLDFYGVCQRSTPKLRCLGMDERNLYFTEEEHRWAHGRHSSLNPPRVHLVRTTGIPIIPALSDLGDQDGGREMENTEPQVVVQGPRWVDECGANGDVNMSFCSRASRNSPHSALDTATTTSKQTLLTGDHSSPTAPGIWNGEFPPPGPGGRSAGTTSLARAVEASIRAPTGRWPGWAPCWRHEEFPYLTVGEMVDFRAGVRVTARHCFMLETLSVHVRPSLSVRGLGGRVKYDDGDGEGSSTKSGVSLSPSRRKVGGRAKASADVGTGLGGKARLRMGTGDNDRGKRAKDDDGGNDEEVQFADEMWDALLGKGFICGDERWLIGEDKEGTITILRF
ncbi:hypothetical protein VMCG_01214 [Cytospora schulzeri]|uniref:F-box domain-containing protein n=1 Tax=Cytospora schulzeri TaxID=448051 RepID=A0A423X5H4_9PEZI|nr:hypothetical protein VMCG_01214 [Valsa malicola]